MSVEFFSPTAFEVPKFFKRQTRVFGIGKNKAEILARELNDRISQNAYYVIYGCAGALRPELRAGQIYIVSDIKNADLNFKVAHPSVHDLACASLVTSDRIVSLPEEKRKLHRDARADLVDMEMKYIWKNASDPVRERLIFVRGVLDEISDSLQFVHRPAEWLKPHTWIHATTIMRRLKVYRHSMENFLRDPRFWIPLK